MCVLLSPEKGSRFQSLQRSRKVRPASRAIRSSFGWPHVSKRGRECLKLAVNDPVMVRDGGLGDEVGVLVEAEMLSGDGEGPQVLTRWELAKRRNDDFDHEAACGVPLLT